MLGGQRFGDAEDECALQVGASCFMLVAAEDNVVLIDSAWACWSERARGVMWDEMSFE